MNVETKTTGQNATAIAVAAFSFFLSTVITWYFIYCGSSLYHFDMQKMALSCAIAGAKWGIQLLAAFFILKDIRWLFISRISLTCLTGSLILLPFCFETTRQLIPGNSFLISLVAAVIVMLVLYYYSVKSCGLSIRWYLLWLLCLATAICLQLTVIFHVL